MFAATTTGRAPIVAPVAQPQRSSAAAPAPPQNPALDPTFGTRGIAKHRFPGDSLLTDAVRGADGSILLAGTTGFPYSDGYLVRYTAQGKLDQTFGKAGVLTLDAGGQGDGDGTVALAQQPDGRILLAQDDYQNERRPQDDRVFITRFEKSGKVDRSFGTNGRIQLQIGTHADGGSTVQRILVQPNGKITAIVRTEEDRVAAVRLLADGSFDKTYGKAGVASFAADRPALGEVAAFDKKGRLVVAGMAWHEGVSDRSSWIGRLTADGRVDTTFGNAGQTLVSGSAQHDSLRSMVIGPDGSIVAGGIRYRDNDHFAALTKFTPQGKLDTTFGAKGVADSKLAGSPQVDVAQTPIGELILSGSIDSDFAVQRFSAKGRGGAVTSANIGRLGVGIGSVDESQRMLQTPQGIVLAGTSLGEEGVIMPAVVRLKPLGPVVAPRAERLSGR